MDAINNKILSSVQNGNFLEVLQEAYFDIKGDSAEGLGLVLSQLHNEHQVDIIDEFLKLRRDVKGRDFFSLRYVFSHALPSLESSVIQVMKCIKHLANEAEDDITNGLLIGPFLEFCKKTPSRIKETLSISLESVDEYFDFISPSLIAGAEHEFQYYFETSAALVKNTSTRKDILSRAIFSLGRIRYGFAEQSKKAFEVIIDRVNEYDSTAFSVSVRALFDIYIQNPSLDKDFLRFISDHLHKFDDLTIYTITEALSLNSSSVSEAVEDELLTIISKVNPESIATINVLDWLLTKLLDHDRAEKAVEVYEEIFKQSQGNIPLTKFDSFSTKLLSTSNQLLSKIITKWLLSKNAALCRQLSELFQNPYSEKNIEVMCDLSQLAIDLKMPHLFLARKSIGWLYLRPVTAISFVISMIDSCSKDELVEIENVCFHPLLISYPGSVRQYLEQKTKNSENVVKAFCKRLLLRLKKYHLGLDSVRSINELRPSEQDRYAYSRRQQRLMDESMKAARSASLFGSLGVQESLILYGNKSISYIHIGPEERVRQEIPLRPISTSIEFPSLQVLDPHGLDQILRMFRIEGCNL